MNHYLRDIWASLYKMKPEMTEKDVAEELRVNRSLMDKIMTDESFENYRNFTRLDDLSSAIGTMKFGEKTNQWLADQKERDKELQKKTQEITSDAETTPKARAAGRGWKWQ